MIAVAVLGVLTALLCVLLKQHRPEFVLPTALCFGTVLSVYLLSRLDPVLDFLQTLADSSGLDSSYYSAVLKALGIGLVSGLASDTCTDAGQKALASGIDLAAKLAILLLCVPMLSQLLGIIQRLLGGL